MSLVEDIQASAVDNNSDLGTVLRKCKLLAVRLGSQPLEEWLLWESNGYPDHVAVPDYRQWPVQVKGHFAGYMGAGLRDVPIPNAILPEDVREQYQHYKCQQSIAAIEAILAEAKGGSVYVNTSDLALALGRDVFENYNCIQTWAEFGKGNLY